MSKFRLSAVAVVFGIASVAANTAAAQVKSCPEEVYLNIGKHSLEYVEKRPICVGNNDTFEIQLTALYGYDIDKDEISVVKKANSYDWIESVSVNVNRIRVKVRNNIPPDAETEFEIGVTDVGVLDPRVRIITNYAPFLDPELINLEKELLKQFGISYSTLLDLDDFVTDRNVQGRSFDDLLGLLRQQRAEY